MSRLLFLWLILATFIASAQEVEPGHPVLTLPKAAELVLRDNPRLQSADFGREVAATRVTESEFKPQWSVALEVEDILGTGPLEGLEGSESTLRLSRIFQNDDKRSGRIAVASAAGSQFDNKLASERLDLLAMLAHRFVDVIYQQEVHAQAAAAVDVWKEAGAVALEREKAGAAPAVDRLRSEMRVANAALSLENAGHELSGSQRLLAAMWGATEFEYGNARGNLCGLQAIAPFEVLSQRIDRNPDLLGYASERRLREAEARLATARQRPDWTLSAGVRHLAATNDQALVFGVSVPFGSKSRAEPALQRTRAMQEELSLREQDQMLQARATLFDLFKEAQHTIREVEFFDNEILPKAKAITAEIEDGYRVGRFSYTALINAQTELLAAGSARLEACADHHRLLIDIERLTGGGPTWLVEDAGDSP